MSPRNKVFGAGKQHFEKFVDRQTESVENPLPLTHTTDAFDFRDISDHGEVRPRYCGVFSQELSYYFYGRPAYRKNGETLANSLAAYAPIVLIFKPEISERAIAAFPFDTGAFKGEMYSDVTHHRMRVEDFGLHPSQERIGKLVAFFFGDNKRYYDQIPATKKTIGKGDFEAESYQQLTSYQGKNQRDDRATTIELLFDSAVKLSDGLLAIVAPNSLVNDSAFKKKLRSLKVTCLPYSDGARLTPASQIPLLNDVVRHFYIQQGIIKK